MMLCGLYLLDEGEGGLDEAHTLRELAVPGLFLAGGVCGSLKHRQARSGLCHDTAEFRREGFKSVPMLGLELGEALPFCFQRVREGAARGAIRIILAAPEHAQHEMMSADLIQQFHGSNPPAEGSMAAATTMSVSSADALERIFGKTLRLMEREVLANGTRLRPVDLDARLGQPGKSAGADAANDDRVDLLVVQRLQGIARAVRMMLVPILYRRYQAAIGIHNDKHRCGTEMAEDLAFHAFIVLNGKTELHR